jgi:Pacifastin inhibitor (LCMII)
MRTSTVLGWLSVAGFVSVGVASGCGGSSAVGDLNGAVTAGQDCSPVGKMAPAADGCNTCTCASDGKWACTEKACGGGAGGSLDGGATICKVGETKPAGDGCNNCSCTKDGEWACTLLACVACVPGMTKDAPDGCNTCTCDGTGNWVCTEKACLACTPGEMKMVDCNTCSCSDTGQWACTKKACACTQGQTMTVDCNTCACAGGQWACTARACPPTMCPAPVQSMQACDTVIAWAKDPAGGTCCMYSTACNAPAGWNKFNTEKDCAAYMCAPPVDPGPAVSCPAVIAFAKDPKTGYCCQYSDPCHAPIGWKQFTNDVECQKAGL